MNRRTFDTRMISSTISYTSQEICNLLKIGPVTVRKWIKNGLPVCCPGIHKLINGAALIEHVRTIQTERKVKMKFEEMYCMHCKKPHVPFERKITLKLQGISFDAVGLCPETKKPIYRKYSVRKYDELLSTFTIAESQRLDVSDLSHYKHLLSQTNEKPEKILKEKSKDDIVVNQRNERLKYEFRVFLATVKRCDQKTWVAAVQNLQRFERYNNMQNLTKINIRAISDYLNEMVTNLSLSSCEQNVRTLREFYIWLERSGKYKGRMDFNFLSAFSLTTNQRKTSRAVEYKESYELDEIRKVIASMPRETDIEQRNLAMISLQSLCGMRTAELRTIKIKNLIFDKSTGRWFIYANPKDMEVKFSKTRKAFFMPFDKEWVENVIRWRDRLIELGWTNKDPLFPATKSRYNNKSVLVVNLTRESIRDNKTARNIFKKSFTDAESRYINPHNFRHTITRWAGMKSTAALNAVSQSLGHSDVQTTVQYYGQLPSSQIGQILNDIEAEQ